MTDRNDRFVRYARLLSMGAAVAALAIFVWALRTESDSLNKLIEITYQFLLVAVVGGAGSLFYKEHVRTAAEARAKADREATRNRARLDAILETQAQLMRSYGGVKQVRRLLRARAIKGSDRRLDWEQYDELIEELSKHQLELQGMVERFRTDSGTFGVQGPTMSTQLDKAREFLSDVIEEYENAFPLQKTDTVAAELGELSQLLDKAKDGGTNRASEFFGTIGELRKNLEKLHRRCVSA